MWNISRLFRPNSRRFFSNFNKNSSISEEIKAALDNSQPVVALESTIITHGMPFPENVKCALEVEKVVRNQGAVPATVAIIDGAVKVGLNKDELIRLGDVKTSKPIKTSRRDMAYVVSNKLNGGTTVSGTLIVASRVGIPIFATGGIGGVHREGEVTFDISADLIELGKSNVAVVSSGVKSILDIPKTLEYLETQGVFVATLADPPSADFPAFYCRKSGFHAPYSIRNARQAARIIQTSCELGLNSGMLLAVPVPHENSLDQKVLNEVIEKALRDAKGQGIAGKLITPFLLGRIAEMTQGKSLETNVALIKNNARTAAEIAVELCNLRGGKESGRREASSGSSGTPVVIGGSNLDCSIKLTDDDIKLDGRIHFGKFSLSAGGVGRNIAEALSKLGRPPVFISAIGADHQGQILKKLFAEASSEHMAVVKGKDTAQCTSVFDAGGDCKFLLGDMEMHQAITPEMIRQKEGVIKNAPLLVIDANLSVPTIATVLELATKNNIPVFFEPTDVIISSKPFETQYWKAVKFITPNLNELKHIASHLNIQYSLETDRKIDQAAGISKKLVECIDTVIVTLGADGLLIARKKLASEPLLSKSSGDGDVQLRHYPAEKVERIANVSGAGDCLASGLITSMLEGLSEEECVSVGFAAARSALGSSSPVAENLFGKEHAAWKKQAQYFVLK